MKKIITTSVLIIILALFLIVPNAEAYHKEAVFGAENKGDFVLVEGKSYLIMNPGESITKEIVLTNRLGKEVTFKVEIEDFAGSKNPDQPTANLLGDKKGKYSLKDYIYPEVTEFTLKDGERIYLPVTISLPQDARPGGLFGALAFSDKNISPEVVGEGENKTVIGVSSRLAYLFFVKVRGQANEDGNLYQFYTDKKFYERGPVQLNYSFENNGNVHLSPSGSITIKNMLGTEVEKINLNTMYAIPDGIRYENIKFNKKILLGKYSAKIEMKRGYLDKQDVTDSKTIVFWVVPWKILLIILISTILVVWLVVSYLGKFRIIKNQ